MRRTTQIAASAVLALSTVAAFGGVGTGHTAVTLAKGKGGTRPGWGCGDKNHTHTGPPGNRHAKSPCGKSHGKGHAHHKGAKKAG